jgi:hypothetical protein
MPSPAHTVKEVRKRFYEAHKEAVKEKSRKYKEDNKETVRAKHKVYCKKYYKKNKKRILAAKKEYDKLHRAELSRKYRIYQEKNKEVMQKKNTARRRSDRLDNEVLEARKAISLLACFLQSQQPQSNSN